MKLAAYQQPTLSNLSLRRTAGRLLALALAGTLIAGVWFRQPLYEWWQLRNYHPEPAIVALADHTAMSSEGRKIFYLGQPQIDDKQAFSQNCPVAEHRSTLVLGCYSQGDIFILDVDRIELVRVMDVTAAHEMLHAAYERLDGGERSYIDGLMGSFYQSVADPDFKSLIEEYQRTEPGQLLNELHSLLGTEFAALNTELESYYARYFSDRAQVVSAFQEYEAVFENISRQRDALVVELEDLKVRIDGLQLQYDAAAAEAESLSQQIASLRAQGKTEQSNQLVPAQNAAAARANDLSAELTDLIEIYNQKVDQVNQLALLQNDLVQSLAAPPAR